MHELPSDLTNSLRSYRGSIYGKRGHQNGNAGARETDELKDGEEEQAMSGNESVHSTGSMRPTEKTAQEQGSEGEDDGRTQDRKHPGKPKQSQKNENAKDNPKKQKPKKQDVFDAPPVKDIDPAADRLAEDDTPLTDTDFYQLMGIEPPTGSGDEIQDLAEPNGLFAKIAKRLRHTQQKYRAFAITIYALLVIQLGISAVFIVLGSLPSVDTHIAIVVLGAIATVFSGALAFIQGQGLPNRLRQARDGFQNVVFEAEELFWDQRSGRPILYRDVKKIREDYLRVLEEQRRNHPDVWNEVSGKYAEAPKEGRGGKGRR